MVSHLQVSVFLSYMALSVFLVYTYRYNVRLPSVQLSKEVRTKFGSFYANGRDERPPEFKPYSIRNLLTQETRIRLSILQVIGRRYKDSNQGSQVKAIGYDSRPILRIIPPSDAQSRRVRTYNFVEAVHKFPTNFSKSDLEFIFSKVGYKQKGQLRSLFICISDDMLSNIRKGNRSEPDQDQDDPMVGTDQRNSNSVSNPESGSTSSGQHPPKSGSNSGQSSSSNPTSQHPLQSGSNTGKGFSNSSKNSSTSGKGSGHGRSQKRSGSPVSSQPEKSSRA